ncbi:NRDE family protein [Mesonia ostreae]|uniref:NRDE family protein n=1 Tax=Mesonia ostreae TaxID=861110 RepID=A0ABU2KF16_9FLAO|nr:NRDE family protein [Mesonia ostreae]MDT0293294.1 NRDE family protein [Mesonia ostreae]
MCTLTFFPLLAEENSFIFTSSRDESIHRPTLAPQHYFEDEVDLYYPKDKIAGGTWVGFSSQQRLVCLMNGGFESHQRKSTYKLSRGVVVKEALKTDEIQDFFESFDLKGVEPFTLISIDYKKQLQIWRWVWDGKKKHLFAEAIKPQIWSAAMTYNPQQRKEREQYWEEFLKSHQNIAEKEIWDFHHQKRGDLIIDRGELKTTSITQAVIKLNQKTLQFEELSSKEISLLEINPSSV